MMAKTLSLIVPVFNMEKYLRQCLDSVVIPEKSDLYEVIVVNDGSGDSSLEIINEYASKYHGLFRVINKFNGGYGSCFNIGLQNANGRYIKMLDSDDWFDPNAFRKYLDILVDVDEDVIVNNCLEYDDKKCKSVGYYKKFSSPMGQMHKLDDPVFKDCAFIHCFAFKKELFNGFLCPEKLLYTDNLIVAKGLSTFESLFNTGLDVYVYRMNRDGQSVDSALIEKRIGDFEIVFGKLSMLDISSAKEGNKELVVLIGENLVYGIMKVRIKQHDFHRYKEIRGKFRKWLGHYAVGKGCLRGGYMKLSLLCPSRIAYLCGRVLIWREKCLQN